MLGMNQKGMLKKLAFSPFCVKEGIVFVLGSVSLSPMEPAIFFSRS